eukprot:SAG31_NODE_437_length_15714_cov_8.527344_17_plen_60_part_01
MLRCSSAGAPALSSSTVSVARACAIRVAIGGRQAKKRAAASVDPRAAARARATGGARHSM